MASSPAVQLWLRWWYFLELWWTNIFATHNSSCTTPMTQRGILYLCINPNSDAHSTKIHGSVSAVLTSARYLLIYLVDVLPPLQGIFITRDCRICPKLSHDKHSLGHLTESAENWYFVAKINYSCTFWTLYCTIGLLNYWQFSIFSTKRLWFLVNSKQWKKFKYSPKMLFTIGLLGEQNHSLRLWFSSANRPIANSIFIIFYR